MEAKKNEKKIRQIVILKQYLQYLYKIKFLKIFSNFGAQRRALEDLIVETYLYVLRKEKEKDSSY